MKKSAVILSSFVLLFVIIAGLVSLTYSRIKNMCCRPTHSNYLLRRKQGAKILKEVYQAEQVSFKSSDNLMLSGLLIPRAHAQRVLLFCHGFWQAKELLSDYAGIFTQDTLFFFDFRAHGDSEGDKISFGYHESQDVHAARNYLAHDIRIAHLPVVGIGLSMGSASLLKALSEKGDFKAVIIDSGFAELSAQLSRAFKRFTGMPSCIFTLMYPILHYLFSGSLTEVNCLKYSKALEIPVLIIHSQTDKTVPVEDAHALYAQAPAKKSLWIVTDAPHVRVHKTFTREYQQKVTQFLDSFLPSAVNVTT